MIILAGHIKTDPDMVDQLADALRPNVDTTLQEDGCLNYHFAIDDREAGTILFYERWRDADALAKHLALPAVGSIMSEWADRVDMSSMRQFDAINERSLME